MKNKNLTKRLTLGTILGIVFGILCFAGFASNSDMPTEMAKWQIWSWSNAMMWGTIANRTLLGIVVALAGFMTYHPLLGFKIPAWARGMKMGSLVSLPMAIGALMNNDIEAARQGFWFVLIAGTIIGMIIDLIITKFAGEGSVLCTKNDNKCN